MYKFLQIILDLDQKSAIVKTKKSKFLGLNLRGRCVHMAKTTSEKTSKFVFDSVIDLAGYLEHRLDNPTPLKIQKTLYFLWAFYSATYGNIQYDSDEKNEFDLQDGVYPPELFEPDFEAWRYGPVINKVYAAYKGNEIKELNSKEIENKMSTGKTEKKEILLFIINLVNQINEVNDFGLVQRSHKDKAWKDAYDEGKQHCKIDSEQIKQDYINYIGE